MSDICKILELTTPSKVADSIKGNLSYMN
ncbi:hypothetical protein OLP44_05430 [Campylobacter jejuni]|nr:hypothetical protein [Campylobacter jejuni]